MSRYLVILFVFTSSCAVLYRYQVGEIDNRTPSIRFEVKLDDTGFDIREAGRLIESFARTEDGTFRKIGDTVALFQIGPRTGLPTFNEAFGSAMHQKILDKCPRGAISGLALIRELRKYPAISGEIIKVTGYCHKQR